MPHDIVPYGSSELYELAIDQAATGQQSLDEAHA